jgi:transposase-like protein
MTRFTRDPLYRRHRFPAEVIAHAVWLYFRFPLSLRMVEDMLAARGVIVSHQSARLWAEKFGRCLPFHPTVRLDRFDVSVSLTGDPRLRAVDRV